MLESLKPSPQPAILELARLAEELGIAMSWTVLAKSLGMHIPTLLIEGDAFDTVGAMRTARRVQSSYHA